MFSLLLAIIYLAALALGLPDSLLGSAWPTIQLELGAPLSGASLIFMIITTGTIISSIFNNKLVYNLGTCMVSCISIFMTGIAILGSSFATQYWHLCVFAIPYGLGAGSVDATLNNYVALHYKSRHISWFHALWGTGAIIGPYIISHVLVSGHTWNQGYRYNAYILFVIAVILLISYPLWKRKSDSNHSQEGEKSNPLNLKNIFCIVGAKEIFISYFCYGALEQTTGLWASSYMVLNHGLTPALSAKYASIFCIGLTVGRVLSGFMTIEFSDKRLIRLGMLIAFIGIVSLILPYGKLTALIGLILIGLGCAPIYPCMIHSTPDIFGKNIAQSIMGMQLATCYAGIFSMPPLFGLIANYMDIRLYPLFLVLILALMKIMYEKTIRSKYTSVSQ